MLFFFLFMLLIVATTRTITTIISSSASEGKGTLKTSYKLWSFEFWNFRGLKEWATPKLVLLPTLGLGSTHTHTHTQGLIAIQDLHQVMQPTYTCFPHTWVLRLTSGFWACNHVVNSPCNSSRKRRRRIRRKRRESLFIYLFIYFCIPSL
jgi:hypothetical protein